MYWFLTVGKNHITEGHKGGLRTKSGGGETPSVFSENEDLGKLLAAELGGSC